MTDVQSDLIMREYRITRRLARLFRIERSGRLSQWPPGIGERLVGRRALLIEELLQLEQGRPDRDRRPPAALDEAMRALSREVEDAELWCHRRLEELGAELRLRRGLGVTTGLRDGGGPLLGRG
ncbi:MAG TPA: hypothetical protein VM782_22745 [Stellaceae bacterium]|nr:hypothetical protein [Stellaceae bacterium]